MSSDLVLMLLTFSGAALCWWPAMVEPSVDFPRWIIFLFIALITALSASLSAGRWVLFLIASNLGVLAGLYGGFVLFPPRDPIARTYVPVVAVISFVVAFAVSLIAAQVGRKLSPFVAKHRQIAWLALVCCVLCPPIFLALTPLMVAHRMAQNDQQAAARFASLQEAVDRTAGTGIAGRVCDGLTLQKNYSGLQFSTEDWLRITGNYVTRDGYVFMVYCQEQGGYTIDAHPRSVRGTGTREFCTDESRTVGCRMEWNRSRHECKPCRN